MISPLVAIGALVVITELFASYNKPTRSDSYKKQDYIQDSFKKDDRYEKDDRHEDGHHEKNGHHENKHESIEDNKYDHDYKMKEQVTFARTYKHEPQHYEEEDYKKDDGKQESHEDHKEHVAYDRTYKHEPEYYEKEYHYPIKEVLEVPKYDHRGGHRHDGGDSHGEPHSYRLKRSAIFDAREERVLARWEAVFGSRDAPSECKCSAACLDVIPGFHRKLPAFRGL